MVPGIYKKYEDDINFIVIQNFKLLSMEYPEHSTEYSMFYRRMTRSLIDIHITFKAEKSEDPK